MLSVVCFRIVHPMTPPLSIRGCPLDFGGVLDKETKAIEASIASVTLSAMP